MYIGMHWELILDVPFRYELLVQDLGVVGISCAQSCLKSGLNCVLHARARIWTSCFKIRYAYNSLHI